MAESELYDVLIVGAGPCGLAVAARLRESHPSALFTDEEQARYNWIAQHASKASIKNKRNGTVRPPSDTQHRHNHHDAPSMLTLDASGAAWMSSWNRLFSNFGISHLRSPMFFHPDPQSRDALLAYTYSNERDGELQEITGCVGKEISKHRKKKERARHTHAKPVVTIDERDRQDYFTPSTAVFNDFCESCITRYGLSGRIKQERVQDIDYSSTDDGAFPGQDIFTVRTNLATYHARVVVLAVGAGKPTIPKPFPRDIQEGACHAMAIQKYKGLLLDRSVKAKMDQGRKTSVLVIGGGLTSAQVADAVVKTGVTQVHLLMRSAWKTKPFDVDLSWIAKFRNHQQASFWSADTDEERLEYVKEARNGGSITPRFSKKLKQHVDSGRLQVHCHTTVQTRSFDKTSRTWRLTTDPPVPDLPDFDYIYFATGASLDFETVEYLQALQRKYPIETCGGFPVLNDDLMWPGVPLFMTGRLATLRIGPGAGNLEGARVAAERCSWAIENLLGKKDVTEDESAHERYVAGVGSRFESLMDSEEAESE